MDFWTQLARFSFYETEQLYLRPFTILDSSVFYEISQNPDNLDFIFPVCQSQEESDYLLVHRFLQAPLGTWAIEEKATNRLIGAISFDKIDGKSGSAEVGYFVRKSSQGKGYATEALRNIAFISLRELGLRKLMLVTHKENLASQKVAQKAGFVMVKRFKGSDRYSRKTREYIAFALKVGDNNE